MEGEAISEVLDLKAKALVYGLLKSFQADKETPSDEFIETIKVLTSDLDLGVDGLKLALALAGEAASILVTFSGLLEFSPTVVYDTLMTEGGAHG